MNAAGFGDDTVAGNQIGNGIDGNRVGKLRQRLLWKHDKGYRTIGKKIGDTITRDEYLDLQELYNAGRLYLGDISNPVAAHEVTTSLDELIQ